MDGFNAGKGACCPQRAEGVTHLKAGERSIVVGLMGLNTVFRQLHMLGRHPDAITDEELVEMTRTFNYIPDNPGVEADYAAALRQTYALFHTRAARAASSQNNA